MGINVFFMSVYMFLSIFKPEYLLKSQDKHVEPYVEFLLKISE